MKSFLSLFFLILPALFAAPLQEHSPNLEAIQILAESLGMKPEEDLIEYTQTHWLRSPSQERWEMTPLSKESSEKVLSFGLNQGLYEEWKPGQKTYHAAVILGATTGKMRSRIEHLNHLFSQGSRFEEVIFLTGERPLDPKIDEIFNGCKTESEAAVLLWDHALLPKLMRSLKVTFLSTPMKGEKRPNTADTLYTWIDYDSSLMQETEKTFLFISDQPFCGYQFATIEKILPENLLFDVVGTSVDPRSHPLAASITLDSLARWIYQAQ